MAQNFTLTITISKDGETVIGEVAGISGKKCSDIAALLDQVGEETEHRHTADYDRPEPVTIGAAKKRLTIGRKW